MALTLYQTKTQKLLQNPVPNSPLYALSDLILYINAARYQVAMEGECIQATGGCVIGIGVNLILFSGFSTTLNGITVPGISAPFKARTVSLWNSVTNLPLYRRSTEWFMQYYGDTTAGSIVTSGTPTEWCIMGQGTTACIALNKVLPSGSICYLIADMIWCPIDLVDDTTVEAIPFPWTEAVPYYAAYRALLSSQRPADADQMLKRYSDMMARARGGVTQSVLAHLSLQVPDPTNQAKLAPQQPPSAK